jgi:hypothetical protein
MVVKLIRALVYALLAAWNLHEYGYGSDDTGREMREATKKLRKALHEYEEWERKEREK